MLFKGVQVVAKHTQHYFWPMGYVEIGLKCSDRLSSFFFRSIRQPPPTVVNTCQRSLTVVNERLYLYLYYILSPPTRMRAREKLNNKLFLLIIENFLNCPVHHLRINKRRPDIRMPKHLFEGRQLHSFVQKSCSIRMAPAMRSKIHTQRRMSRHQFQRLIILLITYQRHSPSITL